VLGRQGWRQLRGRGCASRGYMLRQHTPAQQGFASGGVGTQARLNFSKAFRF